MDKVIVIIGTVVVIGYIVWWFFGKHNVTKEEAKMSDDTQEVTVTVNGGYIPSTVVLQQGVPAKIVFDRKDPSGCFNEVVFPDFGVHETLPIGQQYPIEIDTSKPGEYQYSCGMNMFHGKVIIK